MAYSFGATSQDKSLQIARLFSFPVSLSRYNVQAGFLRTAVNDFANESADCVLVAGPFYIFLFFIQRNLQVLKYAKDRPSPKVA